MIEDLCPLPLKERKTNNARSRIFASLLCDNVHLILSFPFLPSSFMSLFHLLCSSLCLSVSSDTRGRVPASGSVWIGCWLWDGCRSTLPGVSSHHLSRNQSQEPFFRLISALSQERAVRDRCHPWGHRGDHRWGKLLATSFLLCLLQPLPSHSQSKC